MASQTGRLSQEEIATLVGTHRTEVSLSERGGREPRFERLFKLTDSLKVNIGELSAGITWKPAGTAKKQSAARFKISQARPNQGGRSDGSK